MPHRSNILYCMCERKPFFRSPQSLRCHEICHILQYFNVYKRTAFYMFCNAQKMCKARQSSIEPSSNCHSRVIESRQSTPEAGDRLSGSGAEILACVTRSQGVLDENTPRGAGA